MRAQNIFYLHILALLFILHFFDDAYCQKSAEYFGKNRIQYKIFDWEFFSTDKYEVYFYEGGKNSAEVTMEFLKDEFEDMTTILGHHPYHKPKIFIYNSQYELAQSNVGVNEDSFHQSGKTKFTKAFIEIAFTGAYESFNKELKFQISKMIINDQLYGGSLLTMFKSGFLNPIPDWYINGLARYIAEGWSVEMDSHIRDLLNIKEKKFRKLNWYRGKEAAIIGQSIWNYIVNVYKKSGISYINNLTRLARDEEKSILSSLGLGNDFNLFLKGWYDYYSKQKTLVSKEYEDLNTALTQAKKRKSTTYINNVVISPDGRHIAYSRIMEGKYKVIVKDIEQKREKTVYVGGSKLIDSKVTKDLPLISWRNNDEIGVVTTKKGSLALYVFNINNRKKFLRDLSRFKVINGFSFSQSGSLAAVSGTIKDNSDIYIISLKRYGIKRITRDVYDDIEPKFIPRKKIIVFSSNRDTDSLLFKRKKRNIRNLKSVYNVFLYDIDNSKYTLKRITNYQSKNSEPYPIDVDNYLYMSDIKGINQLFHYNLSTRITTQLTSFSTSIQSFDYNPYTKTLAFIGYKDGYSQVFIIKNFSLNKSTYTKNTPMVNFKHIKKYLTEKKSQIIEKNYTLKTGEFEALEINKKEEIAETTDAEKNTLGTGEFEALEINKKEEIAETTDAEKNTLGTGEFEALDVKEKKKKRETSKIDAEKVKFVQDKYVDKKQFFIDTDNYEFVERGGNEGEYKALEQESYLEKYLKLLERKQTDGPFPYQLKFATKSVVTDWIIDNYRGFGMKIESSMNSELENSQLKVGAFIPFSFTSGSDLFLGYEYLKYKLDFRLFYERNSVLRSQFVNSSHISGQITRYNEISQRYIFNTVELGAALPFSIAQRVELTPFFRKSTIDDLGREIFLRRGATKIDRDTNYYGLRFSWVFDNAVSLGNRVFQGLRARVSFEVVGNNDNELPTYRRFKIDARYSLPIHKEITLFTKVFYGRNSRGENMPKYMLGGIKNWISRQITPSKDDNDLLLTHRTKANDNLLLNDFVMGMRGYNINASNGANAMLINLELRIPIFLYLSREHLSSKFLRQFLFGTFLDIGSTWNDDSILPVLNDINREVIKPAGNVFEAVIDNNTSPWLTSYGFRISSIVFGFNIKFDMAIPYNDFIVKDTKYLFSIGYDL